MAVTPTQHSQADQACTIDVEHTLGTVTAAGVYAVALDFNAAVAGDIWIVRVKTQVQTTGQTGSARLEDVFTFLGASIAATNGEKNWRSVFYATLNSFAVTIEQTDGTGRTVPWEYIQL